MRTEEKLYTVYRLKNVVTGKNYIGCTSQKPKERWCREYTGKMKEAIQKFPLDLCWKKHIEFQTPNREQALELEAELMKWYLRMEVAITRNLVKRILCLESITQKHQKGKCLRPVLKIQVNRRNQFFNTQ